MADLTQAIQREQQDQEAKLQARLAARVKGKVYIPNQNLKELQEKENVINSIDH